MTQLTASCSTATGRSGFIPFHIRYTIAGAQLTTKTAESAHTVVKARALFLSFIGTYWREDLKEMEKRKKLMMTMETRGMMTRAPV